MIAWYIVRQGLINLLTVVRDIRARRRLRQEQRKIRRRIKTHFTRMGESLHRHRGEIEKDPSFPELSGEVAGLEARLTELDAAIERVGAGRDWAPAPAGVRYEDAAGQADAVCPQCTAAIPASARYCPACGHPQA
jgi:hypothetical protein